jgi:DNA primase catalytic subunit
MDREKIMWIFLELLQKVLDKDLVLYTGLIKSIVLALEQVTAKKGDTLWNLTLQMVKTYNIESEIEGKSWYEISSELRGLPAKLCEGLMADAIATTQATEAAEAIEDANAMKSAHLADVRKAARAQFLREKYGKNGAKKKNKDKQAAQKAQNRAANATGRVASDAKRAVDKEKLQNWQNVRKYKEVAKDILETQLRNTGAYSRDRQDNLKAKSKAKSKSMKEIMRSA